MLLQSAIMFAVIGSNIHYEWTPNPYLPGLLGAGLALLVTVGLTRLLEIVRTGLRNGR